jgi:outer membrane protein assembly factor BamD (BamD/ComL family)
MSAFLLGRSASGVQAAEWFSTYLKEQPGGALAREALGRLIEAYQAAGDRVSARAAAERYLKSYPDGPHATLARQALHR